MSQHVGLVSFLSLVIGIIIGLIGHYFLPSRKNSLIQSKLAERELQLKKLQTDIDDHFHHLSEVAARLQQQSQEITQLLANEAKLLTQNETVKRRFALLNGEISRADYEEAEASHLIAPRDYAESDDNLSESFSAQFNKPQKDDLPLTPRY